eukprot:gene10627-biopygen21331
MSFARQREGNERNNSPDSPGVLCQRSATPMRARERVRRPSARPKPSSRRKSQQATPANRNLRRTHPACGRGAMMWNVLYPLPGGILFLHSHSDGHQSSGARLAWHLLRATKTMRVADSTVRSPPALLVLEFRQYSPSVHRPLTGHLCDNRHRHRPPPANGCTSARRPCRPSPSPSAYSKVYGVEADRNSGAALAGWPARCRGPANEPSSGGGGRIGSLCLQLQHHV